MSKLRPSNGPHITAHMQVQRVSLFSVGRGELLVPFRPCATSGGGKATGPAGGCSEAGQEGFASLVGIAFVLSLLAPAA